MTEKRCAFLTMDNTDGWAIDSDLSFEPSLYLRMDSESPMRFARAFDAYLAGSRAYP